MSWSKLIDAQVVGHGHSRSSSWQSAAWQSAAWQSAAWQSAAWQSAAWQSAAWESAAMCGTGAGTGLAEERTK